MPESEGTSLWLVPPDNDALHLDQFMNSLKSSSTSRNSFPSFNPHITLLTTSSASSPEIVNSLRRAIPTTQRPIPVVFSSIEAGSHYFRSVYITVQETDALQDLHAAVHKALDLEPKTPKFPHLSLCYIDDADTQVRGEVVQNVLSDGRAVHIEDGVKVKYGPLDTDWIQGFECREIWIMECSGPVEEWKFMGKICF